MNEIHNNVKSNKKRIFTEASLSDSEMFRQLNKSASITSKIGKLIQGGYVLDKSFFEEQYLQITKTRVSPLAEKVLRSFEDGTIKLIYNKKDHLTIAVPFIVLNMGGKPTGCIFISDFSSLNKEETALTIEMKKLYTLMEGAYLAVAYFTNPNMFVRSSTLSKCVANIYAEMSLRILNREFALSLEKDMYDSINYMLARFCLTNVLPLQSKDLINAYAKACCKKATQLSIDIASDIYERENITSVESFIVALRKTYPKLAGLTYRYYFERWISSYGTGACLSIDSFPYFYYVIINALLGSFLINVTGISEIVKNAPGISQFYGEISRMC